jgi:hypothetical protein
VHALGTSLNDELSPELDSFISAFCSVLPYELLDDEDANHGVVTVLSLLPALRESDLVANRIIRRLRGDTDRWRAFFEYCDEHGESA